MTSEAAKQGYENGFFELCLRFRCMVLSGIERLLDTRRGRRVWSGVGAASRTLWVSSAEIKDVPHYPHRKRYHVLEPAAFEIPFRSFTDSPVDRPTQEHGAFVDGQS